MEAAAQKLADAEKEAKEKEAAPQKLDANAEQVVQTLAESSPANSPPTARLLHFDSQETFLSSEHFQALQLAAQQAEEERQKRLREPAPPAGDYKRQKSCQWWEEDWKNWEGSYWGKDRSRDYHQDWHWDQYGSGWSNWSGEDAQWEERQRLYRPGTLEKWGSCDTLPETQLDDLPKEVQDARKETGEAGPGHSKEGKPWCMHVFLSEFR